MKQQTIQRKIKEWATFLDVEVPQVVVKLYVKQKRKISHTTQNTGNYNVIYPIFQRILGTFNSDNNKITIYRDGNNYQTIKHEFIHYLIKLKKANYLTLTNWDEFGQISYDEFIEKESKRDEELIARQLTCAGWNTIFDWYHNQ